jgi:YjbR
MGAVTDYGDVPLEVLAELRSICLSLPDAYEEPAWTGTRWRVRQRTIAHVLALGAGSPNAHARAAGSDEDVVVVTFRAQQDELQALRSAGHPFFYAGWGRDVVGMVIDADVDWSEVRELMTESYCVLAPKKLTALVDRPPPPVSKSDP